MAPQSSATADAVTSVLLAGDVILNLSNLPLNVPAGTAFFRERNGRFEVASSIHRIDWRPEFADSLTDMQDNTLSRVVVCADEESDDLAAILHALELRGIQHLHCHLTPSCDSDDFMDEADTEAVTERLRQLGYL